MKKTKLLATFILLLLGVAGIAVADHGIDPVPETQGISTSTTIIAVGNFDSHTELAWEGNDGGTTYAAVYTEDTQSSGTGIINYDKELDIDTGAKISGQSNIEATKILGFVGLDGGRVYSSEYIMVDGSSSAEETGSGSICVFGGDTAILPAYCNRAEMGSTIDMSIVNVRTSSDSRFVMESGDYPVELNHEILVTEYIPGVPSKGMVSAFIDVLVHEGRGDGTTLAELIRFREETSLIGEITTFEKRMHYESGLVR